MDKSPDPNKVKKIREKIWSETGRSELICSIPLDFKMSKSAPASPKRKDKSLFFTHSTSKTSDKKNIKVHNQDEDYHSDSNGTSPPAPNAGAAYKIPKYKGDLISEGFSSFSPISKEMFEFQITVPQFFSLDFKIRIPQG